MELYDLSQDIGERRNLALEHPQTAVRIAEIVRDVYKPQLTGGTARRQSVESLAPVLSEKYGEVAPGEHLELRYAPNVTDSGDPATAIAAELEKRQREEVARGLTVAGPHRDDLEFSLGGLPAAAHASQGQQRTAILAFKLAEVEVLSAGGQPPVLLLDDVMSELDAPRRQHLVELVESSPQALITSAEESYFPPGFVDRVHTRRVVAGHLEPLSQ